jgi:hypothetical protein
LARRRRFGWNVRFMGDLSLSTSNRISVGTGRNGVNTRGPGEASTHRAPMHEAPCDSREARANVRHSPNGREVYRLDVVARPAPSLFRPLNPFPAIHNCG